MKLIEFQELMKRHHDEFLKFDRVNPKRSNRTDLHAFLLLDQLVPNTGDMISAAEHDEFFLEVNMKKLAEVITEDQIIELIRCGVRITEYDCLGMFA